MLLHLTRTVNEMVDLIRRSQHGLCRVSDKYAVMILCGLAIVMTGSHGIIFFHDSFSRDGYLDPSYQWFDEGRADSYEVSGGRLSITATRGQDLWSVDKRGAPLMLHGAPVGVYEVDCFVDARWMLGLQELNTQVGLFVFRNTENWLFFGFTDHSGQAGPLPEGNGLIVTRTLRGQSEIIDYQPFRPDFARLHIVRSGNNWRFFLGLDDGSRREIGSGVRAPLGDPKVGMGVKSFQDGGSVQKAHFDDFTIISLGAFHKVPAITKGSAFLLLLLITLLIGHFLRHDGRIPRR